MKLCLSVRIGERFFAKREAAVPLAELADIAVAGGYHALCMRASQLSNQTHRDELIGYGRKLRAVGLGVSMVTGDFPIPENTDDGPQALRRIGPYLDLAEVLGADIVRVALRKDEDIPWAQRAADEANERGIRLAHQCHTKSLFETIDGTLDVLSKIGRSNFGLTYEPANLELCGEPYGRETIKRFAPHIINVYLQNHRIHPAGQFRILTWRRGEISFDQIPMWEPDGIDFPDIMGALDEIGYNGFVTMHQASLGTPREDAANSARYLRSLTPFEPPLTNPIS